MLTNPTYIYIISFTVTLLLYSWGWSSLYKPLDTMLLVFFIITFIFSFIIGLFIRNKKKPVFIQVHDKFKVRGKVFLVLLLMVLQIILDPQVPLLNVFLYSYSSHGTYGTPILHPFILTYSSFISVYIFHLFVSEKKIKYLLYFIMANIPAMIFYSRGTLMVTLIACIFLLLLFYRKRWSLKKVTGITLLLIVIMYAFGYLGDARTGGTSAGILYSGGATEKFKESIIPDEFFWSYIYITSPLANLNYNISEEVYSEDIKAKEIVSFIIGDFVPDVISNRLLPLLNIERVSGVYLRVHNNLTVSTIYLRPYYVLRWLGLAITYIYLIVFITIFMKLLKKSNPYYVTGICFLNTLVGLNFFSNMLGQTSVFAPLVYAVVLGYIHKKRGDK